MSTDIAVYNLHAGETAAILAGLRLLQQKLALAQGSLYLHDQFGAHYEVAGTEMEQAVNDILTNGGTLNPLSPAEIDYLCERINRGNGHGQSETQSG